MIWAWSSGHVRAVGVVCLPLAAHPVRPDAAGVTRETEMSGRLLPRRRPAPGTRPFARRAGRLRTAALGTALAVVLVPVLAACGGDASSANGSSTLKWASTYFPTHWDPVVGGSGAQFRELALVYASLTDRKSVV